MTPTWASKNLIPAIGNTKALIHVFIVILFFENYSIYTQQKSLLDISISFDKVQLAPFICFFYFIAAAKAVWFFIAFTRVFLLYKFDTNETIPSAASFMVFLLFILIFAYIGI